MRARVRGIEAAHGSARIGGPRGEGCCAVEHLFVAQPVVTAHLQSQQKRLGMTVLCLAVVADTTSHGTTLVIPVRE